MSSSNKKFFSLICMLLLISVPGCTDSSDDGRTKKTKVAVSETTTSADAAETTPEQAEVTEETSEETTTSAETTIVETEETVETEVETDVGGPDVSLFEKFLAGEVKADFSKADEFPEYGLFRDREINSDGYTLPELTALMDECYTEYKDDWVYEPTLYYAYIDCGGDGVPELAVKYENLNIYSEGDNSSNVMIFGKEQDSIKLVYCFETWARSYTEISNKGLITSYGSSGAASHSGYEACIDADGEINYVVRIDYEGVFEACSYYEEELELFAEKIMTSDIDVSTLAVIMMQFGDDEKYYTSFEFYDSGEPDLTVYSEGEYYELFTNSDLNYVTPDEIEEMHRARIQELNLTEDDFSEETDVINWIKLGE